MVTVITVMMVFILQYPISLEGGELTSIILVRHAEKAKGVSIDPWLDSDGRARAKELDYILNHVNLDAIYATPFKRTIQTVMPIATNKDVKITTYKTGGEETFLKKVLKVHSGGTVLIVGHSNTIPKLVNVLLGEERFKSLEDNIYDNLFFVTAAALGNARVIRLRFGVHTPTID